MHLPRYLVFLAVATLVGLAAPVASAQTNPPVVASYSAGWNMVAGPAGTDFSAANFFQAWTSSGYVDVSPSTAMPCTGYWAYFTEPTTVTLPAPAVGPAQTCLLQPGWNILGNPFAGTALLPPGLMAWWFNPNVGVYQLVSAIPPGGAVWVTSSSSQSVTLQFQSTQTPIPQTLVISDLVNTGPFTIHLGDSVKLQLPVGSGPFNATASPFIMHLESAGTQGPASCIGANCAVTLVNQIWVWKAVNPGTALINVSCGLTDPNCGLIPTTIEIDVLP